MFNQDNPPNKENPIDRYSRSTIDKIEDQHKKDAENRAKMLEKQEEYRKALNRMASTPDGQYVLKQLIEFCGVFAFDNSAPDGRLAVEKGRRQVYLQAVRPFLDKSIIQEIES